MVAIVALFLMLFLFLMSRCLVVILISYVPVYELALCSYDLYQYVLLKLSFSLSFFLTPY